MAGTHMHTALQSVVKYFHVKKESHCVNDFRLSQVHYKFAFGALVACAILSGLTNWYSRIDCAVSDSNLMIKRYIEEWCYANSTFLVKETDNELVLGNHHSKTSESIFYVGYYQWVTLALLAQAVCFQVPRLLWKSFEGGRVSKIFSNLHKHSFSEGRVRKEALERTARYYHDQSREGVYRHYFHYFALCQCLYFINALAQICFVETFLYNEFLSLLPSFLQGSSTWNHIFPKIAKCEFHIYGPTGVLQTVDVLCVLAMNVLFEKLYLLVWIVLAVALCAAIAQNLIVFKHMIKASVTEADKDELDGPNGRLIMKFLKSSLDRTLYDELEEEINRLEANSV